MQVPHEADDDLMPRSLLVGIVALLIGGGLTGCGVSAPPRGRMVLETKGLPTGAIVHFAVDGHGIKRTGISAGASLSLAPSAYSIVAHSVADGSLLYVPLGASVPTASLTTSVHATSGHTTHFTQIYALDNGSVPLSQGWRLVPTSPGPYSTAAAPTQEAVACAAQNFCMAVTDNADDELSQTTWNGTNWSPLKATGLTGVAVVDSLSCPGDHLCMMGVGTELTVFPGYVEMWNGTDWASVSPVTGADYYEVSCASPDFCMATGEKSTLGAPGVAIWQGAAGWQSTTSPAVSPDWLMDNVDCSSPTFCALAFGLRSNGTNALALPPETGLVAFWVRGSWQSQEELSTNENWIECRGASYCLVVAEQASPISVPS